MACELNAPLAIIGAGTPKPMVPFFVIGIPLSNFLFEIIGPHGFGVVPGRLLRQKPRDDEP